MNTILRHGAPRPLPGPASLASLHPAQPASRLAAGARPRPLVPRTLEEAGALAEVIAGSGLAPAGFDTPQACLIAILHGLELGLTPLAALQRLALIEGRPTLWGDGALALVRASGLCTAFRETLEGSGPGDWQAVCTLRRRGEGRVIERRFGVEDARRARLWGKPGPWSDYPQRMLQMRARAFALRDGFADVLGGLYVREELEGSEPGWSAPAPPSGPRPAPAPAPSPPPAPAARPDATAGFRDLNAGPRDAGAISDRGDNPCDSSPLAPPAGAVPTPGKPAKARLDTAAAAATPDGTLDRTPEALPKSGAMASGSLGAPVAHGDRRQARAAANAAAMKAAVARSDEAVPQPCAMSAGAARPRANPTDGFLGATEQDQTPGVMTVAEQDGPTGGQAELNKKRGELVERHFRSTFRTVPCSTLMARVHG